VDLESHDEATPDVRAGLSPADEAHFWRLEAKFQLVHDRTRRSSSATAPGSTCREFVDTSPPASRRQRELAIVREIVATVADSREQRRLWKERTGKCQATFYRRPEELKGNADMAFSTEN
jgi:hypothetical protein